MKHQHNPDYPGPPGKCDELWHAEMPQAVWCTRGEGHDDDHYGFGFTWTKECKADRAHAVLFMNYYRRIPNGPRGVTLNDDGSITCTIEAFGQAVQFIGTRMSDD